MRKIEAEPIQKALQNIQQGDSLKALEFKKIEGWRDALKSGNTQILEEIIAACPTAQRQHLNQLVRNARKPASDKKDTAKAARASKALFQYLREIHDQ